MLSSGREIFKHQQNYREFEVFIPDGLDLEIRPIFDDPFFDDFFNHEPPLGYYYPQQSNPGVGRDWAVNVDVRGFKLTDLKVQLDKEKNKLYIQGRKKKDDKPQMEGEAKSMKHCFLVPHYILVRSLEALLTKDDYLWVVGDRSSKYY